MPWTIKHRTYHVRATAEEGLIGWRTEGEATTDNPFRAEELVLAFADRVTIAQYDEGPERSEITITWKEN